MENVICISEILSRLMFEAKIRTAELARRVKLPQPTVHRIVTGTSPKPHLSSLTPIAEYFGITLEQLRGVHPIPGLHPFDSARHAHLKEIPLISWEDIIPWSEKHNGSSATENIFCDIPVSDKSFALRVYDTSAEPQFPKGTLLIIDPEKQMKDRNFVVVKIESVPTPLFRQLFVDGSQLYIKPPAMPQPEPSNIFPLKQEDKIYGSLVQIKLNFND